MIFNPVADYSQQLARQEEATLPDAAPTGDSHADRINRFILSVRGNAVDKLPEEPLQPAQSDPAESKPQRKQHKPQSAQQAPPAPSGSSLLSESLAKIYIKNHRYERAYEILNRLSLAFPEKNAYFADQLRFLRKLMLAESIKMKQNS